MSKDFDSWNQVKKQLDARDISPRFQERQIWWCSVGVNFGFEVYGKGQSFMRPVLMIRKFSRHSFWGIPLTTKILDRPYHLPIYFKDREVRCQLAQFKLFDSKRLSSLMGYLSDKQFDGVVAAIANLLPKEKPR